MSTDQLSEVERLASLMFSAAEVCLIMNVHLSESAFIADEQELDEFGKAMLRGRLKQEAEVRASIFDNAKAGSSPAQTLATQLIHAAHVAAAGV
ncbi:hypothetical protein [Hymenobacter sp. BT190]|uniref:hypothetical protein n=1 Tax=Hymenobacter sp. BT190 TaxID=2763505 RepID=UPI00165118A6|nr:hypothetical protein [Hymenobacter sp. BT190]MBC6698073.1 hypothetical protein [Hymenobacter sp. BT190]